jgi:hypothetical protein
MLGRMLKAILLPRFQKVLVVSAMLGVVLFGTGCISQKPLPYSAVPAKLRETGPQLSILPIEDRRAAKDDMDRVLAIPQCVEVVLAQEMEGVGMFQKVSRQTSPPQSGYTLRVALDRLQWEVPNYDRILGTTLGVSIATGGLGGLIYGSTGTEVLGHASMEMVLTSGDAVLLNKKYVGLAKEEKAKMNSDTPATYREVAAKAVADAISQFKADLLALETGGTPVKADASVSLR